MTNSLDTSEAEARPWVKPAQSAPGEEGAPALTKEETALGAFLAAMHDSNLDGGKMREAMLNALGLTAASKTDPQDTTICQGCNGSGEGGVVCIGERDYEGPCHICGGTGEPQAQAGDPEVVAPTEAQFVDWCERHGMQHADREAFFDAASLYLSHPHPHPQPQAERRVTELESELAVSDKLLQHREQLLNAIPDCPVHGSGCVPHALEWIEAMKAQAQESKESGE